MLYAIYEAVQMLTPAEYVALKCLLDVFLDGGDYWRWPIALAVLSAASAVAAVLLEPRLVLFVAAEVGGASVFMAFSWRFQGRFHG